MKMPTSAGYSASDICDTFTISFTTVSNFNGAFASGLTYVLPGTSSNFLSNIPK